MRVRILLLLDLRLRVLDDETETEHRGGSQTEIVLRLRDRRGLRLREGEADVARDDERLDPLLDPPVSDRQAPELPPEQSLGVVRGA